MCIVVGKSLAVFWNSCVLLQSFWAKMPKSTFFKKKGFECSIYEIESVGGYKFGLPDLKNTKQLKFCLG